MHFVWQRSKGFQENRMKVKCSWWYERQHTYRVVRNIVSVTDICINICLKCTDRLYIKLTLIIAWGENGWGWTSQWRFLSFISVMKGEENVLILTTSPLCGRYSGGHYGETVTGHSSEGWIESHTAWFEPILYDPEAAWPWEYCLHFVS